MAGKRGAITENEIWLHEFAELIKADKSCIEKILYNRQPGKIRQMSQERLAYVRSLIKLC